MFCIVFTRGAGAGGDQTPSIGLRHPSFKEEGAGKRCSECQWVVMSGDALVFTCSFVTDGSEK